MIVILIIVICWLCLGVLIYWLTRDEQIKLSLLQVLFILGCKISGGAAYGYIYKRNYNGDDTWGLNQDAWLQYKRLLEAPLAFAKDLFSANPFPADDAYYFHPYGYLENLEFSIITKTIALFDIISQGNYYINLVFFNFLSFWGLYFLYKVIAAQVQPNNKVIVAAIIFLFPPALFWLSGIRAEGLLILFTGMLLYAFERWLSKHLLKHALICFACLLMILILRNGFALLLVPALVAWWVSVSFKLTAAKSFAVVYGIAIAFVVAGSFILPARLNALSVIADRQHDFFTLKGNTRFELAPLDDHPLSFIKVLPQSLLNTFIRPFAWEAKGPLQWFAAAENMAVLVLFGWTIAVSLRAGKGILNNPVFWVLFSAGLFNYLLTGYTVPFPGAIVRYKLIPELLLICACLLFLPKGFLRNDINAPPRQNIHT